MPRRPFAAMSSSRIENGTQAAPVSSFSFCSPENAPFQKKCASSEGRKEPSIHRFSLYSVLILLSDTGHQFCSEPSARRLRRAGTALKYRAQSSAWYVMYPPNSSSAPSPDSATVTCLLVMRDRNQTGTAPASAQGSSAYHANSSMISRKSISELRLNS